MSCFLGRELIHIYVLLLWNGVSLFLIIVVVVAWYIDNSFGGDESAINTKTHHYKQGGSETDGSGARTGNKYFDPTKRTPEASPAK